jgi:nucleoside-diphosphate-sugar epimerase
VLGASGAVGRDLVSHLGELGFETVGVSSRQIDLTAPASVDLLQSTVRDGDAVVVAATITPDRGKDIRAMMRNLAMGEHLACFLERTRCAHVIYLSSDSVYENAENPVRESSLSGPESYYSLMHLARERMLAAATQKAGSSYLILRPTLLYGPTDTHNSYGVNRFLRSARAEGRIALFGHGEEKRDHVFIKDLNRLIGLCLLRRSEGLLNVATGHSHSFLEVARMVAALFPGGTRIEYAPRGSAITHRHFDVTATIKGFPSFLYTPLAAGISATFRAGAGLAAA